MIVGIDPGLNTLAVYQGSESVVFTTVNLKTTRDKLGRIYNFFCSFFKKHSITGVFLECVAYGAKARVADLGAVNGIILLASLRSCVPDPILVPSTKWKYAVLGKGNSSKEEVAAWVESNYNKHFETQHEYDAFCIWRYGTILGRNYERS